MMFMISHNGEEPFGPNISEGHVTGNGIVYKNTKCNYQITFPSSWDSWYLIDEFEDGSIVVKFYGKSKAGSIAAQEDVDGGLPMFVILKESLMLKEKELGVLDSIKELGTAGGIKYYYATGTSSSLGALFDQINSLNGKNEELDLVKKDFEKMKEMLAEAESIIETFCEVK